MLYTVFHNSTVAWQQYVNKSGTQTPELFIACPVSKKHCGVSSSCSGFVPALWRSLHPD